MRIQSSRVAEQMDLIAQSLSCRCPVCWHVLLTLCSHTLVSLPGDSSVLLEVEEEVEEEGPNPTIPSSNSSISRCHHIPNSSIR